MAPRTACSASTSPLNYATDHYVYLTYIEPGEYGGSQVLARGKLDVE
ncbi:MAG: hypothetical protein R2724_10515 [Bryobacterales bacterium]